MFWMRAQPKDANDVEKMRRNFDAIELPDTWIFLSSVLNILSDALGYRPSIEKGSCVLGNGQRIPMMSYGLVEYLLGLDLSGFDLLELGGGGSTEFWLGHARSVVTIETSGEWAKSLEKRQHPRHEIRQVAPEAVAKAMLELGRRFGVVVIDCAASRYRCALAALQILAPGGFVILDNSDWYPNTARALRDGNLIQIDFHDFRPLHHFRCTTSLFLHPEFRARPLAERLPLMPIGGKDKAGTNQWDRIEPGLG